MVRRAEYRAEHLTLSWHACERGQLILGGAALSGGFSRGAPGSLNGTFAHRLNRYPGRSVLGMHLSAEEVTRLVDIVNLTAKPLLEGMRIFEGFETDH